MAEVIKTNGNDLVKTLNKAFGVKEPKIFGRTLLFRKNHLRMVWVKVLCKPPTWKIFGLKWKHNDTFVIWGYLGIVNFHYVLLNYRKRMK